MGTTHNLLTTLQEMRMNELARQAEEERQAKLKEEQAAQRYSNFVSEMACRNNRNKQTVYEARYKMAGSLIESALWEFVSLVDSKLKESVFNNPSNEFMARAMINNHINENSVYEFIKVMESANVLTSSIIQDIKEAVEEAIPDDMDADSDNSAVSFQDAEKNVLDTITNNDTVDEIAEKIATSIGAANQEFILKMQEDYAKIDDILNKCKDAKNNVRTGSPEQDKVFKECFDADAKKAIIAIRENEKRSVFEQLVYNIGASVLKSENLKEDYTTENGQIDMDKKVDKVKVIYTVMESLYGIGLLNITTDNLLESISIK